MSMVIAHNIPALQTYNIVNNTSNALQKSIAKLSSGLRINSAADDAAGLAISEKMRSQVKGLDRAVANTQDGISMIQTAEGALSETHSILQRMRELSVQAANDTLTQQDRSYIQEEVDQLKEEITRIGNTTQFNKKKLLNGDSAALWSSNNLDTKAIINGGLREVDQFGQKKSIEGNYKISVKADPGQGQVQKSDIMTIKHPNVIVNKVVNSPDGVKDVVTENMAPGTYTLKLEATGNAKGAVAANAITGSYGVGGTLYTDTSTIEGTINNAAANNTITVKMGDTVLWSDTSAATRNAAAIASAIQGANASIVSAAKNLGATVSGFDTFAAGGTVTATSLGNKPAALSIVVAAGTNTQELVASNAVTDTVVDASGVFTVATTADNTLNGSILFEVQSMDASNKTMVLKATATTLAQDGSTQVKTQDGIVLKEGGTAVNLTDIFGGDQTNQTVSVALNASSMSAVKDGGKFVAFVSAGKDAGTSQTSMNVDLTGSIDGTWEDRWNNGVFNNQTLAYHLDGKALADTEIHFTNYILNAKTGEVSQGDINLITGESFSLDTDGALTKNDSLTNQDVLAKFSQTYVGKVANGDVKLRDLDKFWNSEGTFMLDDSKKITLTQGNGKETSVTLYANDTLDDVAKKFNDAIASGLGQSKYVDDATKFATFVSGNNGNSEAVPGTFIIRSVVPGADGEITFSGDENIINAFSLNEIQSSKETVFTVDVSDEHTGKIIAQGVKTTGNVLHGVIHENVDVEFSALSGVTANWSDSLKKYTYTSKLTDSTLHLADNTTVLQIGANEGEDLGMNIGDMRAHALGLDGVNVMSHDRAARSITVIDNAIDKVSTQRANLGAYQNRLEYTASNLTTASENLTSAESRIRDADMAKEMMQFTKLNIMLQAGNSMLAQANQQPQNVLSLIR